MTQADAAPKIAQPRVRVIAGFGRSGTTWVQDALAEANQLRAVFEPLHPMQVPGAAQFACRHVAADGDTPELYAFLHKFLLGNSHSLWTDYRVIRDRITPSFQDLRRIDLLRRRYRYLRDAAGNLRKYHKQRQHEPRLVKFIRANMMLAWIQRRFDALIVFVIRHPVPVILSQLKSPEFWNGSTSIEHYRNDAQLVERLDSARRSMLFEPFDELECLTLSWCIENSVALDQAAASGIPVVFYENLVEQGRPEWQRIAAALELAEVPDAELASRPSQQAYGAKAADAALLRQHQSWRDRADRTQLQRIQHILDRFGLDLYHTESVVPRIPQPVRNP